MSEKQKHHAEKLKRAFDEIAALKLQLQTDYLTSKEFAKAIKEKVTLEEVRQALPNTSALKQELTELIQTVK